VSAGYVELHGRSAFSFLRGASPVEKMVRRAAELEMPALAITDHGGFQGSARAHKAARECGIKAITGSTLETGGWQVPVLCATRHGYAALCMHLTDRHLGRNLPHPAGLAGFSSGDLIALTGGREGPVTGRLLRNDKTGALNAAKELIATFGHGNVCVEITRHHLRDDDRINRQLVDLAAHLKLPVVAANAPLHATRAGRMLADAFTCLRHHTTLDDAGALLAINGERHLKSSAEMKLLFPDLPDALANTLRVAERMEFSLEDPGYRFPDWQDGTGHAFSLPEQTTLLRRHTYAGATVRYGGITPAVRAQLEHEIAMIHRLGFSGYFLIVHDLVLFARGKGILCQGRGSAANSAVCYALGLTHVDPVGGGLLFERFLSDNRRSWPDIDIDFPSGPHREEVIQYVFRKYGERGAAMTANVITYQPKSAFREMAKVLGLPESLADRFSRTRKPPWAESGVSGRLEVLRRLYQAVLGLPRHLGQHSGGMIICDGGLDRIVPLQPSGMPGRNIVQWDKEDCEDQGIVKVDLLGLGMLAAMEETLATSARRGRAVDLARIPKDDPEVFAMLCRADTVGTFQVESRAQMATLPVMLPATFYDVAIQVAIIRPGPIVGDLVHPYLNRRNGREPVDHIHPLLEPVLSRTLGVPLFQEQVLRIAMILADFTGAEADELRRAMGSSRSSERMERMTRMLRERMTTRDVPAAAQEKIIKSIGSFALYGFPESHAISFALIAYASCWLKVHRAVEFYAGLINHQPMGFYSVNTLIQDARRHGIRVRPVSCIHSAVETTVIDDRTLRLGLHRLKGLSAGTAGDIINEREKSGFLSLEDFLMRVRPGLSEKRLLAASGALNGLPGTKHRREALWQAELPFRDDLFASSVREKEEDYQVRTPLAAMTAEELLDADLDCQGATTGPHPMALWRRRMEDGGHAVMESGLPTASALGAFDHGTPVNIAGLVICRQRPSTAKGHCFITMEDETGIANWFIPKKTFELYRQTITTHAYLLARGRVQIAEGGQATVFVTGLEALPGAAGFAAPHSHDFH
jgi:error-prone DNA polymerase